MVILNRGELAEITSEYGYGMEPDVGGGAIYVKIGGKEMRADGRDIDAEATLERFSEANGWSERVEITSADVGEVPPDLLKG
jgi:hypothetical protein